MEEKGKKLSLMNLVGFGVGNTIGTGIFVMLGFGIAYTGRGIPLAMLCSALFMLLSAWAIFGMSTMFVFKGGDYAMKTLLFNPLITGVNAWFSVINSFGYASLGLAFASYVCVLFPGLTPYTSWVAFVVITITFIITMFGSRTLTVVENVITWVLLVALALFVAVGIFKVDPGKFFDASYDGGIFHGGLGGFLGAISVMAFVCMGQTAPTSLAAVAERPKRNVPMSMLLITLITGCIYALMAYVASGVLPYEQVAGANLSVTAEAIFPKGLYLFFVVGGGLCAIGSSMLSTLGYIRYPMIQVANEGWLPAFFKKQDKNGYPYMTYGLYFLISVLSLALKMDIDSMVSLVMIPMMLICAYLNLACITLPKKYPQQWAKRSIKMPLWLFDVCCVLGAGCACVIIYNLFINMNTTEMIVAVVLVAALFGLSALRLKQGAVKPEYLLEQRRKLEAEALEAEAE